MIKLREARLTDAVPGIVAAQPWVKAIAGTLGNMDNLLLDFADRSQIYTDIDNAPEKVLDALAICWNVTWYDTGYTIDTKRRVIKTAFLVRKNIGTKYAVREQTSAVYPDSEVEEWFEYDGTPGEYRISVNITDEAATVKTVEEMEKLLGTAKRMSAHMESLSYMVRHGMRVGKVGITAWVHNVPECGTIYCGTYPIPSQPGYSMEPVELLDGTATGYAFTPPFAGTVPMQATGGWSAGQGLAEPGGVQAFTASPEACGINMAGMVPSEAQSGQSLDAIANAVARAEAFITAPSACGMRCCGQKL